MYWTREKFTTPGPSGMRCVRHILHSDDGETIGEAGFPSLRPRHYYGGTKHRQYWGRYYPSANAAKRDIERLARERGPLR